MQPKPPSIKRTRDKRDAGELGSPRRTKPSPAAHQDASGILQVPPAGKTEILQGCFILAKFDHHGSAEPAPFPVKFEELGFPLYLAWSRGCSFQAQLEGFRSISQAPKMSQIDFQDREKSEHRQFLSKG